MPALGLPRSRGRRGRGALPDLPLPAGRQRPDDVDARAAPLEGAHGRLELLLLSAI